MQRHRTVEEGARIYNLFPLLAGSMDRWSGHLRRAREMEFNWVFINPFHLPGFSGSLYSVKDYYQIHPLLLAPQSVKRPMEQLKEVLREVRKIGLRPMMDLVLNHTAVDSPLIKEHPEWFLRNDDGSVVNPSVWEGDRQVAVWGDLAEVDNAHSPGRAELWKFWQALVFFYRDLGVEGFRCDAAYQVTDHLWKVLIGRTKERYPGTLFFAETLGCEIEDVVRLARAGFDYTFNSSKYWDFEEPWCLSQYRENAAWAPSVSFAESHDTARLLEELGGDVSGVKERYLFSALFSTGVMMPIGFEFGFRKPLHVVNTRPEDWEATGIDLTGFVREVNRLKKENVVFNEDGPLEIVDLGNARTLGLKKTTFQGDQCALIILNKDRQASQTFRLPPVGPICPGHRTLRDVTPEATSVPVGDGESGVLPPSGYRVFLS